MRRAYIDLDVDLPESLLLARQWAGDSDKVTIIGHSTSDIEASPYLKSSRLPIGIVGNRRSRFTARPRTGTVIAWCLSLDEILDLEGRADFDGLVLVRGHKSHAPWITAHDVDFLGGEAVAPIPEASAAIKLMIKDISLLPIRNQGLVDSRERSTAVQALTFMRDHGHQLVPEQLAVEALRNDWPRTSPLELADLARQLNAGKHLRFQERLVPAFMARWTSD